MQSSVVVPGFWKGVGAWILLLIPAIQLVAAIDTLPFDVHYCAHALAAIIVSPITC